MATKPIFRLRRRSFVYILIFTAVAYILYQFITLGELFQFQQQQIKLIRGTHYLQRKFYEPLEGNLFQCIHTAPKISFSKVNDDYCDCPDGSDEPGTNACPDSQFFCTNQIQSSSFRRAIHSSKVNDGICDCCDGSDEWEEKSILKSSLVRDKFQFRQLAPCQDLCPVQLW